MQVHFLYDAIKEFKRYYKLYYEMKIKKTCIVLHLYRDLKFYFRENIVLSINRRFLLTLLFVTTAK